MTDLTSLPQSSPAIRTRQQLETVVANIVEMQRSRAEMIRTKEAEIDAIWDKHRAPLAEVERYLDMETAWVENWMRENPGSLGEDRCLHCEYATIGFRPMTPRLERASRRWTWSRIAETLSGVAWGKRYLRQPPAEVDKEALVADLANLSLIELREAGIKIVQGERFFVRAHDQAEDTALEEAA